MTLRRACTTTSCGPRSSRPTSMCSSSTLRGSGKTTRVARRLFSTDRIDAILRRCVGGAQLEDSRGQLVVRLEPSEVAQAFVDHQREHAPPALLGYATDVRRQKDVFEVPQW